MSADDRVAMSRWFISHAREELEKGNRLQASEKAWAAVAQLIKAHGEKRGWLNMNSHRVVVQRAGRHLAEEYGGDSENGMFIISNAIMRGNEAHENFYNNTLEEADVAGQIAAVESGLPLLEQALEQAPRPVTVTAENVYRVDQLTGRKNALGTAVLVTRNGSPENAADC